MLDFRGSIVPVVDLRIRFGVENYEYKSSTVTIILATDNEDSMMGVVVDTVSDVLAVDQGEIKSAPSLGSRVNTDYVEGIVSVEGDMVMLVDSDKLLDTETFEMISSLEGVA